MKQWVELTDWKSELDTEGNALTVHFQVTNPTSFFLTAERGAIALSYPETRTLFIYRPAPLAPNNPLHVNITVPLTPMRVQTYRNSKLGLSLTGDIAYTNALDKHVIQQFAGLLVCNAEETTFEATVRVTDATEGQTTRLLDSFDPF